VHLKLENLQYTSSFKSRGAFLALKALRDEDKKVGVISMSAGNHAQALAFRSQQENIKSTIIMPEQTPFTKISKTKAYGAEVVLTGRTLDEAKKTVDQLIDTHGYRLIHPYDDLNIISGQGTIGLEMMESNPDLDYLIVPIGGGGLISGISIAAKSLNPDIKIIGVESALYPSMSRSLAGLSPQSGGDTLAEGIAVKTPGVLSRPIVAELVDDIILVNERQIEWAIGALIEHQRTISEGAGAAGLAAIYAFQKRFRNKRVGIVVCGGNIDSRLLGTILNRTLISDGRLVRIRIGISDEPGMLAKIAHSISQHHGNIIEVYHQRLFYNVPAKLAKLDVGIETRGSTHPHDIISTLKSIGFEVHLLDEQFQSH
jgi:threonine dehydratase